MPRRRARLSSSLALVVLLVGPALPFSDRLGSARADSGSELSSPAAKSAPTQQSAPAQKPSAPKQAAAPAVPAKPAAQSKPVAAKPPASKPTESQPAASKPAPAAKPAALRDAPPKSAPKSAAAVKAAALKAAALKAAAVAPPIEKTPPPADPQQAVAELVTRALAAINDKDLSPLRRRELLRALIDRHFDLPAMAQAVLGRHWVNATPAERTQFIAAVDDYMVVTYAPRIAGYGRLAFTVKGQRAEAGTRAAPGPAGAAPGQDALLILTAADQPNAAPPIPIDWRAVRHGEAYKITDVIISGVSLIQMKRAEINSVVYWSDGQLTALLDRAAVLVSCARE